MEYPKVRHPFHRERTPADTSGESATVDSAGNDTDVNTIVARFKRTGLMPEGIGPGQYGDVSHLGDLTDTMVRTQDNLAEAQKQQADAPEQTTGETIEEPQTTNETPTEAQDASEPATEPTQ